MSRLVHASRPLTLEALEDRFLLAACHVIRLADLNVGHDLGNGHARGSLRYCINFANNNPGPDTIDFKVTGTIQLTNELPDLASDITMTGPGADLLAVSGLAPSGTVGPIFRVVGGTTVAISALTITDGFTDAGPGGISNSGTLTLTDCTVSNNKNYGGSASGGGGAIQNGGQMTISGCTISDNEVGIPDWSGKGGGILNWSGGVMQIINSTISGNHTDAPQEGAGIFNYGALDVRFSTITKNYVDAPSTSHGLGIANVGSLYLYNTIVAGNGGGPYSSTGPDLTGSYTGSANLVGGDPKLGVLQYNGGHTQTHKVLQMSPALNAGDNTGAPQWDQRGPGFPRIVNGTVDIGAFEVQATGAPTAPDFRALLITANFEKDD